MTRSPSIRIIGRAVLSGAGRGVEALWDAVAAVRPGLAICEGSLGDHRIPRPSYVRADPEIGTEADGERASAWLHAVCREALTDAGLSVGDLAGRRVMVFGGTSLGGMTVYEAAHRRWWDPAGDAGPGIPAAPLGHRRARYDGPIAHVAAALGIGGISVNTACSSAANALGLARLWLQADRADLVLVAGFDIISPFVYAGFDCLNAIDPEPSDPFTATRAGLNLGEGAVAFVLGRAPDDSAGSTSNSAPADSIDLCGYGSSSDAHHLTRPDLSGAGLARAVRSSLADAGLQPVDVDMISAHGTGTLFNDRMEAAAFAAVFGAERCPPLHCAKPMFGHTLGAAGAIDALLVCEALRRREVPPTYRRGEPDPELAVHPRTEAVELPPGAIALSTSSGFGGSNAALILRAAEPADPADPMKGGA